VSVSLQSIKALEERILMLVRESNELKYEDEKGMLCINKFKEREKYTGAGDGTYFKGAQ
jgi:hypothetical protein